MDKTRRKISHILGNQENQNITTTYMSLNTIKKSEIEMTKVPNFGIAVDEPRI